MVPNAYQLIQGLEASSNAVEVQDFADGPGKDSKPP
jgi:hypothetical protein